MTIPLIALSNAYNKCREGLDNIKREKARENNTPRDWEQRIDEIILIYSDIVERSYNDSKNVLELRYTAVKKARDKK